MEKKCFAFLCLSICSYVSCSIDIDTIDLVVHTEKTPNKTNDKFLSVALDTIVIAEKFKNFNMSNERLINMVSYLSPGYLRIGGNLADRLNFSPDDNDTETDFDENFFNTCYYEQMEYCLKNLSNFTMTGSEWTEINIFAEKVGLEILFDLNCLFRNENGSWNTKNAEELIEFSDNAGFNIHWQLGNEPDSFKHLFNYSVNATQLAKDFTVLKTILDKYPRYKKSLLVGPDVTRPRPEHKASAIYLETFLNSSKHILDGVAWHQYYLNGREASLEDFLDPKTFALLETQINMIKDIVNKTGFNNTPIWLTETSSAYGGGAPGLSNTFAGTFLWLDKLGLAAKHGLQTVIRQTLSHGYYALIDEKYQPSPDWWISVLYKRMVGPEVHSCDINGLSSTVRLYCHCTKTIADNPLHKSAITVYGINLGEYTTNINIKGLKTFSDIAFAYIFTAPYLKSKDIYLNGNRLKLTKDGYIPFYIPDIISLESSLIMPANSLIFWVIPVQNICQKDIHYSVINV